MTNQEASITESGVSSGACSGAARDEGAPAASDSCCCCCCCCSKERAAAAGNQTSAAAADMQTAKPELHALGLMALLCKRSNGCAATAPRLSCGGLWSAASHATLAQLEQLLEQLCRKGGDVVLFGERERKQLLLERIRWSCRLLRPMCVCVWAGCMRAQRKELSADASLV